MAPVKVMENPLIVA
jgi:hypothetical protein